MHQPLFLHLTSPLSTFFFLEVSYIWFAMLKVPQLQSTHCFNLKVCKARCVAMTLQEHIINTAELVYLSRTETQVRTKTRLPAFVPWKLLGTALPSRPAKQAPARCSLSCLDCLLWTVLSDLRLSRSLQFLWHLSQQMPSGTEECLFQELLCPDKLKVQCSAVRSHFLPLHQNWITIGSALLVSFFSGLVKC